MKNLFILMSVLFIAIITRAEQAPSEMKKFNKLCPAPKACLEISEAMTKCEAKQPKACNDFLAIYEKLLPSYDCQRPFDSTPNQKYIVPAIWLCESHEALLRFLSKQQSFRARKLFGSSSLRKTLDGALAEEFKDKSLKIEKSLKKKKLE